MSYLKVDRYIIFFFLIRKFPGPIVLQKKIFGKFQSPTILCLNLVLSIDALTSERDHKANKARDMGAEAGVQAPEVERSISRKQLVCRY